MKGHWHITNRHGKRNIPEYADFQKFLFPYFIFVIVAVFMWQPYIETLNTDFDKEVNPGLAELQLNFNWLPWMIWMKF